MTSIKQEWDLIAKRNKTERPAEFQRQKRKKVKKRRENKREIKERTKGPNTHFTDSKQTLKTHSTATQVPYLSID
jgi:sRNA-binding protein